MQTKLTLKLDSTAILQAKNYANSTHQSVSSMVEGYFKSLSRQNSARSKSALPTVTSLSGVIKDAPSKSIKTDYADFLEKKYSR